MTPAQQRQLEILQNNLAVFMRRSTEMSWSITARKEAAVQAAHTQMEIEAILR